MAKHKIKFRIEWMHVSLGIYESGDKRFRIEKKEASAWGKKNKPPGWILFGSEGGIWKKLDRFDFLDDAKLGAEKN